MEMMVRAAAVGITAAVLGAVLRKSVPELALLLALAAGLWMLAAAADGLSQLAALMEELAGLAGLSGEVLSPLFKVVALSILTRLAVEICRGAGESGVAAFLETAGTVAALTAAVPLTRAVTTLMAEILL